MYTQKYKGWVQNVTIGEFLGFLIPSVVGASSVLVGLSQIPQSIVMILAGLGEGAVLGYFQSKVIHKYVKKMPRKEWIRATIIGAGLAWTIGMLPSTLGEKLLQIPYWVIIPLGALLGMILLLSIGYCQYRVLRNYTSKAYKWIWINAIAWLVGMVVVCSFIFIAPSGIIWTILFSALGGLGMALSMAAITGIYAQRFMSGKSL